MISDGATCGCAGCQEDAVGAIQHPKHGIRVVCDRHASGYEVISNVK